VYILLLSVVRMRALCQIIIFLASVLPFIVSDHQRTERRLPNDVCRAVIATAHKINASPKTFTFRCRPGDDCGGVGDRLGGVIGGAFYSFLHDRSFRIIWPGLDQIFVPGALNWTFDATALKIPYFDQNGVEIDKTRISHNVGGLIYTDVTGESVGVVNDLNTRQIINETAVAIMEKYQHIYFHSNRGPNEDMYAQVRDKNKWPTVGSQQQSYAAAFLCTFEAMFRPAEPFLKSEYKSFGRQPMSFKHLLKIVEDANTTSVAFHHRVDDSTASSNGVGDLISDRAIENMISISQRHSPAGKKVNLFFISNSVHSMHKVMNSTLLKGAFEHIFCQQLTATIHVAEAGEKAILSTMQAMRDWWVMRMSDVLIGGQSGFSKSAALFAPVQQVRYEDEGEAYRQDYWVMCGNRFC